MAYDAELWKAVGLALLALVVIQMGPRIIVKLWMRLFAATYERHLRERPPVAPAPASSSPPPIVSFARGFAQGFTGGGRAIGGGVLLQDARIADAYCRGRADGYKQGMAASLQAHKDAAARRNVAAWNHRPGLVLQPVDPVEISAREIPYRPRNEG